MSILKLDASVAAGQTRLLIMLEDMDLHIITSDAMDVQADVVFLEEYNRRVSKLINNMLEHLKENQHVPLEKSKQHVQ
jgi:hypothetical protein